MRSCAIISVAALVPIVFAACSSTDNTYASLCPDFQSQPTCPVPSGAACVNNDPTIGCALDGLPGGSSCSGHAQCSLMVLPCPNEVPTWAGGGRVDGYICSCVNDRWACDDCWLGEALCAEAPDGASLAPMLVVDAGSDGATDVGHSEQSGLEAAADPQPDVGSLADSPASSADSAAVAQCQVLEGDAAVVYSATVVFTNESEAGPSAAVIEWVNDAGMSESCGPTGCAARCSPGQACTVAFITHGLVIPGGTCL